MAAMDCASLLRLRHKDAPAFALQKKRLANAVGAARTGAAAVRAWPTATPENAVHAALGGAHFSAGLEQVAAALDLISRLCTRQVPQPPCIDEGFAVKPLSIPARRKDRDFTAKHPPGSITIIGVHSEHVLTISDFQVPSRLLCVKVAAFLAAVAGGGSAQFLSDHGL